MKSRRNSAPVAELAAWRKKSNVSLASIAANTKISVRYLEAIEGGKFQALPGGAYSISYIRQYAEAIHFDADDLLRHFHSVMGTQPASEPEPEVRRAGIARRFWDSLRIFSLHRETPQARS